VLEHVGLKQPGRGFPIRRHNAVAPASAASLYSFRRRASIRGSSMISIDQLIRFMHSLPQTVTYLGQQNNHANPPLCSPTLSPPLVVVVTRPSTSPRLETPLKKERDESALLTGTTSKILTISITTRVKLTTLSVAAKAAL
jgi:hypothetical protein